MRKSRSAVGLSLSKRVQLAFGTKLKAARRSSKPKVTQGVIAEALEMTRTSISNIENGRHRVFLDQVYAAAHRLGVPIAMLLPEEVEVLATPSVSVPPSSGLASAKVGLLTPYVEEALRKAAKGSGASRERGRV